MKLSIFLLSHLYSLSLSLSRPSTTNNYNWYHHTKTNSSISLNFSQLPTTKPKPRTTTNNYNWHHYTKTHCLTFTQYFIANSLSQLPPQLAPPSLPQSFTGKPVTYLTTTVTYTQEQNTTIATQPQPL